MSISLNSALFMASNGLKDVAAKMSVTSSNITNADNETYTKKVYNSQYVTTSSGTYSIGGEVQGTVNKLLLKTVIQEAGTAAAETVKSDYLDYYSSLYGDTSGETGLSATMNNFEAAISSLKSTPEDESLKSQVVAQADALASSLRNQSASIQSLRTEADQEIEEVVSAINASLEKLEKLNYQISQGSATGSNIADLVDQRNAELESLSSNLGIQYYFTSDNQVKIYSESGDPLLDDKAHLLSYESTGTLNSSLSYPGGISGIMLGGKDITLQVNSGKLGGLIDVRDDILTGEQQKLDEFASTLADTLNAITNSGASFLPRAELASSVNGLTATDTISASGTVRIALTDSNGAISSYSDISLAGITTMQDLVDSINSNMPGVTASIDIDGKLTLTSNNSDLGVAINELDSSISVNGGTADSFSDYFGFNDIFTGTGAGDIRLAGYLSQNSSYLAVGQLTTSGISKGDGSVAEQLSAAFTKNISFDAAGNFGAKNMKLSSYASLIISDAATQAQTASDKAETAKYNYNTLKTKLSNETGVNLDEETANMLTLENAYNSNATVISTVRSMFEALLNAVN